MKKLLLAIPVTAALLMMTGCTSVMTVLEPTEFEKNKVTIIDDTRTRESARVVIEDWLTENGYVYDVVSDRKRQLKYEQSIYYKAHWGWDMALYMRTLDITAYSEQNRIGAVAIDTVGCGPFGKFGSAEDRIKITLDLLFMKITEKEAIKKICSS